MARTEITNTNKSIKNENGFVIKRFGRKTTYMRATGDGRTVWVDQLNPTEIHCYIGIKELPWNVYITTDGKHQHIEASASGFKTHSDAEKWANANIN